MSRRLIRRRLLAGVALSGVLCAQAMAAQSDVISVDLSGRPLGEALRLISRQAGLNLLVDSRLIDGRQAPTVRGRMTSDEALARLLEGSGLVVRRVDGRSAFIQRASLAMPTAAAAPMLIAQASTVSTAAAPFQVAQAPAQVAPQSGISLEEVVVTATRQSDVVSRVPLTVTAQTQEALDQKGVKTVGDLARTTPGVQFTRSNQGTSFDVNIRGVFSPVGAPTTGIYIDDAPITKRGGAAANNALSFSTPTPRLFDLERVEILRGPQGTLYGGSAMGGAVRFITPTPSLTRYSALARAEVADFEGGSVGYEAGLAAGGPIVADKLGFRGSVFIGHSGGFIDHVDMYTGKLVEANTNTGDFRSTRLALLWQVNDRLRIQPSFFYSSDARDDGDQFFENIPQYRVRGGTINNTVTFPNGLRLVYPNSNFAGFTDGPYNMFGPFKTGANYYPDTTGANTVATKARSLTLVYLPSVVMDYDFDKMTVHSSTSLIYDKSKGDQKGKYGLANNPVAREILPTSVTGNCGQNQSQLDLTGCNPVTFPGFPQLYAERSTTSQRQGLFQELRFASPSDQRPFTWVAGVFYGYNRLTTTNQHYENSNALAAFIRGPGFCAPYGAYGCPFFAPLLFPDASGGGFANYDNLLTTDTEIAGFGDLNYFITDELRLSAGVRVSRSTVSFRQVQGGPHSTGLPQGFEPTTQTPFATNIGACPDVSRGCPFTQTEGSTTENPITPKFGISYQLPTTLIYANAAKGYRPGGVNATVNPGVCAADFAFLGISRTPQEFKSDSIWSYEGGVKARLFGGRAQVNVSAYQIDWNSPQTTITLAQCGRNYIGNAGKARVRGVDFETQVQVFRGFVVSASASRTNGEYTETVFGLGRNAARIFGKGEPMRQIPDFSYTFGAAYTMDLTDDAQGFVRADFQHTGKYYRGPGPGSSGHDPINYVGAPTDFVTARAGVRFDQLEVNVFVNNLTKETTRLSVAHGNSTPLLTSSTYAPRQIGVQLTYRR